MAPGLRAALIWTAVALAIAVPLALAAQSPLLAWRDPAYIAAGFAGIAGLALILLQPLLMGDALPGLTGWRGRRLHRWIGALLVLTVIVHVAGLWLTSPPDVIDVLLFRSPTPFSAWGAIAMWAVFAAALWAALRRPMRLAPRRWRLVHTGLVLAAVCGTVVHAALIEGTMEPVTKTLLCVLALIATARVVIARRAWARRG